MTFGFVRNKRMNWKTKRKDLFKFYVYVLNIFEKSNFKNKNEFQYEIVYKMAMAPLRGHLKWR